MQLSPATIIFMGQEKKFYLSVGEETQSIVRIFYLCENERIDYIADIPLEVQKTKLLIGIFKREPLEKQKTIKSEPSICWSLSEDEYLKITRAIYCYDFYKNYIKIVNLE